MGFIPLAFRTGASGKRTHIFWQRRIREGDTQTPYWYPSKTDGGMMREDRLVLPIPPGVHWKSEMPILIPEVQNALPEPIKKERSAGTLKPIEVKSRRVQFGSPDSEPAPLPAGGGVKKDKSAKPRREKVKADPKHVAAARELRDRYLEQFNSGIVLPQGKYAVGRELTDPTSAAPQCLLPAA